MTGALFRCDAHPSIGLGHLSRCLNLASALRDRGVDSIFAMQDRDAGLAQLVARAGHRLATLSVTPQGEFSELSGADVRETRAMAEQAGVRWLIVDSYGATADHFVDLQQRACYCVAAIDDLGERDLRACALIINPNFGSESWPHRVEPSATVLAGTAYCLLAPIFGSLRATHPRRTEPQTLRRVLVTLGGMDSAGWTMQVLRLLSEHHPRVQVRAIVGNGAADLAAYRRAGPAQTQILPLQSPEELGAQMLWADLAIATPSTIAWELACLGLPAILHAVADNQRRVVEELGARRLSLLSRDLATLNRHVADAPALLRDVDHSTRWSNVCDGLGASRVADVMLSLDQKEM